MKKKGRFTTQELEENFDVLFGKKSGWQWPFWDGDLFGTGISLFLAALLSKFLVKVVTPYEIDLWTAAGIAVVFELFRLNGGFVLEHRRRRRLEKKYLPHVEHTDAYQLLVEAIYRRRRGVVPGLANRKESRQYLLRLWKAAFAEADKLALPSKPSRGDPLVEEPVGEQIKHYLDEREEGYNELRG